ncbi:MAG TPA: hypothetical protein VIU61_18100 [Kofleriaceae bacterium]
MIERIATACLLLGACTTDIDTTDDFTAELRRDPLQVQAGVGITLIGVTDDNHAIYERGQQVFAIALSRNAEPELIADVPPGNTAFILQSGKVAFIWPNPGLGVGPLVIWTAKHGPRVATETSVIGAVATAATRDGERVLFAANASPDGASGDLVLASADLAEQTSLAAGIAMAGPCTPRASFLGNDAVVASCPAGTTAATLAIWRDGERRELADPIVTPLRLRLDLERGRLATVLADSRRPVLLDRQLRTVATDDVSAVNALIGGDGALIHTSAGANGLLTATRLTRREPPRAIADVAGINFFAAAADGLSQPITSDDGRLLSYFDAVDPDFGLTNVVLRDVRGDGPPVTLDASLENALFGVPFTRDSEHALYARLDLATFATGSMFAGNLQGSRQFSDDAGWSYSAAYGSTITFNDNTSLDWNNVFLSTADIRSVDLSCSDLSPRLIAEQANVTYFASHRGHGVAYTIDAGPTAGLYVAGVR